MTQATRTSICRCHRYSFSWALAIFFLTRILCIDGFRFDADTRDDCGIHYLKEACIEDAEFFFACSKTCTEHYEMMGSIAKAPGYPDEDELFFSFDVVKSDGKSMSLEDYGEYITLFAIIPMKPGMAQFYYELLEKVRSTHKYIVRVIVQPLVVAESDKNVKILTKKSSNTVFLRDMGAGNTPVVDYLTERVNIYTGSDEKKLSRDRVTIFIVSASGEYVERTVSPKLSVLERRVGVYLLEHDPRYNFGL